MKNKKAILFISPDFFNYHELIRQDLANQGHTVYFLSDRPSKAAIIKVLIRKFRFFLTPYLNRHYEKIFSQIPSDIDEVFIIKGEALTPAIVNKMKSRFGRARFQIYLWDSVRNNPSALRLTPLMNRVFTFDFDDARVHRDWRFISNFYSANDVTLPPAPVHWHLTFIGTTHSDRLKVLAKISKNLPKNMRFYRFAYFQTPLLYYFRKIFDPTFKQLRPDEMGFKPLLGDERQKVLSSTVAILDIHHPKQTGTSHRAIECMAMGLKLVTTNERIREYPFYDERLVQIIDRNNPQIESAFLQSRANLPVPTAIFACELRQWLTTIFSE